MKKINLLVVKLVFVMASLILIYGYGLYDVSARLVKCNETQACDGTWTGGCNCGDTDCRGCFIPNGQSGCGTCSNGTVVPPN